MGIFIPVVLGLAFVKAYLKKIGLALALLLPLQASYAGLFIPKDMTMIMAMRTGEMTATELSYGLKPNLSMAVNHFEFTGHHDGISRYTGVQAAYLLDRHYGTQGIANWYVFGGPVTSTYMNADSKNGAQGGLWFDYETLRIYTRVSAQRFLVHQREQSVYTAQALWAPYAAEFGEVASWVGVQAMRDSMQTGQTALTPMLRFFERSWWLDIGVKANTERRGDLFMNVMFLF